MFKAFSKSQNISLEQIRLLIIKHLKMNIGIALDTLVVSLTQKYVID